MFAAISTSVLCVLCTYALLSEDSDVSSGGPAVSGTCGTDLTWRFDQGSETLFIEGSGETMYSYYVLDTGSTAPWYAYHDHIKKIVFHTPNLKTIGDCSFFECNVQSMDLPDGLKVLGRSCFSGCQNLTSLVIPSGVTDI
ncbi:leucine-rich repeat protein [Methanomethylophilus alvi]|uniref:leucine-rich repeat protein n=1 Tax=Methanomethylophilus alvi TaxID=1291540 RepID=UPI0037DCE212